MEQDFGTPIPPIEELPPQPEKKRNTTLIVVVVILVVLCCCCMIAAALSGAWLWNNGDQLLEDLTMAPYLLSLV